MSSLSTQLQPDLVAHVEQALRDKGGEWVRLRTLWAVAASGSYRQAARALNLSGIGRVRERIDTLQRHLRALQAGLKLVESDASGTELTAAGRAVVELVQAEFER